MVVVDQFTNEEMVSGSDEEMGVEVGDDEEEEELPDLGQTRAHPPRRHLRFRVVHP